MTPAKLKQKIWDWRGVLVAAPSVAGLIMVLRLMGWLQSLEWSAFDQFFRTRPLEPIDSRIVIVGINEADLKQVGKWPIPDEVLAKLLNKLKAQQPRAIGLDLYRDLPVEPGHQALIEVFKSTPNLIGIEKVVGGDRGFAVAPPPVLSQKDQVGANDVLVDGDGKVRRGLLYLTPAGRDAIASLGLRLAMIYLEKEGITPKSAQNGLLQLGQAIFVPFEHNDGAYVRTDARGYQMLLNFRGAAGSFRTVSMMDVLEDRVPKDWVRDRIVLVGPTAASLNDFFYTSYSGSHTNVKGRTAGVEIQTSLASQILSSALDGRPLIKTWLDPLEYGWIFLWSCLGAGLAWKLQSLQWRTVGLSVAGGGLLGGSYLAFLSGWWIPVVPPLLIGRVCDRNDCLYCSDRAVRSTNGDEFVWASRNPANCRSHLARTGSVSHRRTPQRPKAHRHGFIYRFTKF
jgi:adenylate cyclase